MKNNRNLLIEELIKEVLSTHKRLRCGDIISTTKFIINEKLDDNSLYNFLIYSNLKTLIGKTYLSYNLTLESYIVHGSYQKIKKLVDKTLEYSQIGSTKEQYLYFEKFYYTLLSGPSLFLTQSRRLLNYYQIKGIQYLNHDSKYSVLDIFTSFVEHHNDEI